ncbi:DsbA family protein [Litorisediminicola beolgyonensis]|uniref:DsbA family protein n=1 Tax=Litorisediminicola beolgyonensis TaxID=1173614 RepID=A0ABW3ZFC4_9RHOB
MISRLTTATALALALAAPAYAFDITNMTDAEREAFRAEVRSYLLDNPGVIMEAVDALEAQQAQAQADADVQMVADNADALFEGHGWVGGNPEGDVTVVEFMDYRCGYCRRADPEVSELIESDGNIRFILKEFPILGENSEISSKFAIAVRNVAGDDAYKAAHDALYAMNQDMSEPVLQRLAESLGVDADAVLAEMESDAVAQEIADNRALAREMQISGTPSFVMGERLVRGYVPLDGMRQVIAGERADG